ncbi:MAG: flagellar hook-length control protein FliK [Nitrospirae bacterium]|nr:flagellar hook-length control protein FliK [Nitrospirota bacterium]NTW67413.1 flagellar hook-length control protein FliK [Nitrospirota bacterium]
MIGKMLTPVAHSIQLQEETQPETDPAKPKGRAAAQTAASDFSHIVSQFLGAVVQNTQQTGQEVCVVAGPRGSVAQPAPQPVPQPVVEASTALPENANRFLGVNVPDALTGENAVTADLTIAAPGSEDKADRAKMSGSEDARMPVANEKAAANSADGIDHNPSGKAGYSTGKEKPDLHALPAKQDPSGVVAVEHKTGDPAGTDRSSTLSTGGDFSTVMHLESSGAQNVHAPIGGATITHRAHEGNGSAPFRAVNAADVLDTSSTMVKDGNRIAVKFEQDGLGKLDIDLRLNKGVINAHIQVADDSTKTLIENNMQQIVDSLLKAGLSVGGFSVSLQGGRRNGTPEERYGYGYSSERAVDDAVEAAGTAQRAAANGLVSIFI